MKEQSQSRGDKHRISIGSSDEEVQKPSSSLAWTSLKLLAATGLAFAAVQLQSSSTHMEATPSTPLTNARRLQEVGSSIPSYMDALMKDLSARKKLFDDTPPEEVKYWFEYTGALQRYYYRFSKTRGKADYFEGRDDSGVLSARFESEPGASPEFREFYSSSAKVPEEEVSQHVRLLENCLAMGSSKRPDTNSEPWLGWYGNEDRCRILFAINSVGAGRGTTMLWETTPPTVYAELPRPWMSEQETAATHLERNLKEINSMCATGNIAARVQMLVCEPIPALWIEWMDAQLVDCGGKPWPADRKLDAKVDVEERDSPLQIVVSSSASTAESCHDLKSGFMEKRAQDLVLAPPYVGNKKSSGDPTIKSTNPNLFSSDEQDLYISMKWSTLVSIRSVNSFLQASADIAAAASSPVKITSTSLKGPSSPFLIPSFVRVSYVSEENSKVAKWRMHGDFFHPAAWEISKDSFDTTWIPHSLSGAGGVSSLCGTDATATARKLGSGESCGQWWVYFRELQMSTSPEVFATENVPAPVLGGSNFFWMVTERQRQELVKFVVCQKEKKDSCPDRPQAVIPLGDLESFLINYTPNTSLGKQHVKGRRPGYSREGEREEERKRVKERKQLHDQEDIEKALFDYDIYPAALFHKDATIMAARQRDAALTTKVDGDAVGPQTVKSSYYDVTITKPRPPVLGWCQAIARKGLCTLYADYFRTSDDVRCREACGMTLDWSPIDA